MHGQGRGGGDMAREEAEALAALLAPGKAPPGRGATVRSALPPRLPTATTSGLPSAWLPWAALLGGTAIGVGCILLGLAAAPAIARTLWPDSADAAWLDALFTVVIFVPMLTLTLAAGAATRVWPLRAGRAPLRMLGLGIAVGGCGIALAAGYAAFAGVTRGGAGAPAGLMVLAGSALMLLQSATEEALLRGWMQPAMAMRWREWPAVLLTAAVFAGLHLLGGTRAPVSLVNLAIGGVMFGLLRWKTGGLVAPVAAHFTWNWAEALLLGLDPNPGVGSFGALIDLDLVGPAIWGGSDEGLNASLAMMIVLSAIVAGLTLWRPKSSQR